MCIWFNRTGWLLTETDLLACTKGLTGCPTIRLSGIFGGCHLDFEQYALSLIISAFSLKTSSFLGYSL